jgi:hypothetical protein
VLGVGGGRDLHGQKALARQTFAPVGAQQLGEPGQLILLDQEVRPGPSTTTGLAGAGWAADEGGDPGLEAAIAQRLHLGDRSGHRRDERETVE